MSLRWLKSNERGVARRAFLGSAGTVVALPLLESLVPRRARAAAASAEPKRLIYYYVPDGIVMDAWRPATTGAGYAITPILKPIEALKADFMVVTGTRNDPAHPTGNGDHAAGTSGFITCAKALKSTTDIQLGISADQFAAMKIGMNTRVPSVVLGTEPGSEAGTCDSGYGCPYVRAISWGSMTTPMAKVTTPKTAFDLIFTGGDPAASAADRAKRQLYRKSVLDVAIGRTQTLRPRLGASDKLKLDEYLTSVRETERQVTDLPATGGSCMGAQAPNVSADLETNVKAFSDIMVLAMQCDASRIFTFMLGNAGGQHVYSNLGINRGHHDISHHGGILTNLQMLQTIDTYEIQLLGYFLNKLKSTTDGANNLLFNSTIYFSSEISDGDAHNHDDMPVLIAGHGGGMLNTGQHFSLPTTTKVSDMLLSTLRTVGVTGVPLGDGTAPVMDILNA
ncbi:MAG TPA: DUF1552 domain-containing protein [Polyangia bacterium]|nr:DUF1552 domain-containing protein [Polyangia bacterium]